MESSRIIISHLLPCAEYSANNAFNYNGNNGNLNNNNKNNTNSCRAVLELGEPNNADLESFPIPLSEVYRMYRKTRRHKASKPSHLIFRLNYPRELRRICYEINTMTYTPSTSIAFIVTKPKWREVIAADFRDRVAQTILVQELLPYLEAYEHPHSYSCRVGKGCLAAVQRLQELNAKYKDGVVCFTDLANFFMSIDVDFWIPKLLKFMDDRMPKGDRTEVFKRLAKAIYYHRSQDHCIRKSPLWMWDELPKRKSLFHSTTGLPIGNVTSQTLANFITTEILYFVEAIGFEFAFYTDDRGDFMTKEDKPRYLAYLPIISQYVWDNCHLKVHPHKMYMQDVTKGFNAFGFRIKGNNITPSKRLVHHFKRLVGYLHLLVEEDARNLYLYREEARNRLNSYLGLLCHSHSYNLRKQAIVNLQNSKWKEVLNFGVGYHKVSIKPSKTRLMYFRRMNRMRLREQTLILHTI